MDVNTSDFIKDVLLLIQIKPLISYSGKMFTFNITKLKFMNTESINCNGGR